MPEQSWMIYGAYGFTGQRIVDYALARGHRPVLAGRSKEKTQCLAERYGLDWISVDLEQHSELVSAIRQVRLVVHSAGPFIQTAPPMIQACLDAGVNYIDITGEIPVVQFTFAHNREAKRREILLLSGAGFDVITSDCLAKQLSLRAPDTRELEIIAATDGRLSSGTIHSALEILSYGGRVRRHGKLVAVPLGKGGQKFRFAGQERFAIPSLAVTWRRFTSPRVYPTSRPIWPCRLLELTAYPNCYLLCLPRFQSNPCESWPESWPTWFCRVRMHPTSAAEQPISVRDQRMYTGIRHRPCSKPLNPIDSQPERSSERWKGLWKPNRLVP